MAESIGQAMLEVSANQRTFENGMILENAKILSLAKVYERRRGYGQGSN